MFNLSQLKFLVGTEHYLRVCHQWKRHHIIIGDDVPEYWRMIPSYLTSRCPICDHAQNEKIDTYSLRFWSPVGNYELLFRDKSSVKYCPHVYRVQVFVNFNGIAPQVSDTELEGPSPFPSEIPHVIPYLLDEGAECKAVMHALPICRIEGDQFVPRYTLYMLTYFAPDHEHATLKQREMAYINSLHGWGRGIECRPFPWLLKPQEEALWWDLPYWVEQKRLLWLAPETKDLPLCAGAVADFPFANIEGRKYPYQETEPQDYYSKSPVKVDRSRVDAWIKKYNEKHKW